LLLWWPGSESPWRPALTENDGSEYDHDTFEEQYDKFARAMKGDDAEYGGEDDSSYSDSGKPSGANSGESSPGDGDESSDSDSGEPILVDDDEPSATGSGESISVDSDEDDSFTTSED
jgi:hypothetical protein